MPEIGNEYLTTVIKRFNYYKDLGDKTFAQLEEKDFHFLPSSISNSIAIIVQHLAGNMHSRFTNLLTEDGEKQWRQRDAEFEIHNYSKQQIIDIWEKGWHCVFNSLNSLNPDDLLKTVTIRNEPLTVMDAINRQLAHYPYHIGQLIFVGKMIKDIAWKNLSVPKGQSQQYIAGNQVKDPAKKY
ncbi:MAG TPA: DUF1572 family protein [Chitinophagaceae bacterium]|nr:DUF1572 family protein [Chitinophagaceae bacterium]